MPIQVILNSAGGKPCVPDFFMARQPVLDRRQEALAFELAFYPADSQADAAGSDHIIAAILNHFAELDLLKAIGELRGFVNIDAQVLMSDVFQHIPRTKFVFCLADTVIATDTVLSRLAELAAQGFMFGLGEAMADAESLQKLMPLAEVVRFDLRKRTREELVRRTPLAHFANKKLLIENVDTLAQFHACLALGFDYFQGYHFASPTIGPTRQLAPSQLAIIQIIALVSGDADSVEIEERIKRDVSLGLNLLRLVNTAAVGTHRIDSLRQALMVLGRKQLASWLQVMLYAQTQENAPSVKPLLMLATARGKLLELIAQRHRPGNRGIADAAFTVGIMSLMDTLFGLPMAEILKQIAVVEEVSDALLARQGYYGDLLALIEVIERSDALALLPMLAKFHLESSDLFLLQGEAYEWSNNVAHAMHQ